jgi:hypothetical protein
MCLKINIYHCSLSKRFCKDSYVGVSKLEKMIRPRPHDDSTPLSKKMKITPVSHQQELIHILNANIIPYLSNANDVLSYVLCCSQSSDCLSSKNALFWDCITRNIVFTGGFYLLNNHQFNHEEFQKLFQFIINLKTDIYPRIESIEQQAKNTVFEDYKVPPHSIEGDDNDDYLFQGWTCEYLNKNTWYREKYKHSQEENSDFLFSFLGQFLKKEFVDRIRYTLINNTRLIFKETKKYDYIGGYTMIRGEVLFAQLCLNDPQEWQLLKFQHQHDSYVISYGVYIDDVMLSSSESDADKYYGSQPENYKQVITKLAGIFGIPKQAFTEPVDEKLFEPFFLDKILNCRDTLLSSLIETIVVSLYEYMVMVATDPEDEVSLVSYCFYQLSVEIEKINTSLPDEDKIEFE